MRGMITGLLVALSATAAFPSEKFLRDSLSQHWTLDETMPLTTPTDDSWWETFRDPVLDMLVRHAVENNFNVLAAQQRIIAASQALNETRAGYFPTLSAQAGWNRDQTAGTVHSEHSHPSVISYFTLGLSMNWEIDVFGRIRQQSKADKANYDVSVADYDATLISLCSNLAKAYFQLRMAQGEIAIANRNVALSEELLRIAKKRFEVGLRPSVDVVQSEMSLLQTQATLPALEQNEAAARRSIALLCGEYPEKLDSLLSPAAMPEMPSAFATGVPVQLLRRRPDIVAAEMQVAAAAAQVGIAKKDFLPTLSLQAGIGTESLDLRNLFGKNSMYYNVSPTLSWTIFDGLARNARIKAARADMEAEIDSYNLTVMTAVNEVNNALSALKAADRNLVYQQMMLKNAQRQFDLQMDRYTQGLCAASDVTSTISLILQYDDSVVQCTAAKLSAYVTLYTALGGGY